MNAQANVSNAHRGAGDGPPVAVHASFADEPHLGPLPEPSLLDRLRASWSLEALVPALDRERIEEPEWRPAGIITFAVHALLITGIIVPRPIAWVTTLSPLGHVNLAPFSAFTFVSNAPPMLGINVESLANGEYAPSRMIEKVVDNDHYNVTMWGPGMDGKEYKCMEIAYTRIK